MLTDSEYLWMFVEITTGFSKFETTENGVFYIRHPSFKDFADFQTSLELYKERAKKRGLMTEEEASKFLIENGEWDAAKDKRAKALEDEVTALEETIPNLVLVSEATAMRAAINEKSAEAHKIRYEKILLMGMTVEAFADSKVNEEFVSRSAYREANLSSRVVMDDELFNVPKAKLMDLLMCYKGMKDKFSDLNIQHLCLQDFGRHYFLFADKDYYHFFGKLAVDLTVNQIKVISYMCLFKNIFENHDDIPPRMHKDPQALFDFIKGKRENKRTDKKSPTAEKSATTVGTSYFGATKEDTDVLAADSDSKGDLFEELSKRGGSMNPQEFFEFLQKQK